MYNSSYIRNPSNRNVYNTVYNSVYNNVHSNVYSRRVYNRHECNRNAMELSALFDAADSLTVREKIKLYVDMMSYDFLKPFADESLSVLKRDLVRIQDHDNLEFLKRLLYDIGIDFQYHIPAKTVYDNKQNVHVLSKSTVQAAEKIIKSYPTSDFYIPDELKGYTDFFETITQSSYNNTLDPKSLFMSVWNCICNSKLRDELLNRLIEELEDANGQCLTGCIGRLVNALRGFDFVDFETELDDYEYERSKIFNIFTKHMNDKNITDFNDIVNEIERIVNNDIVTLSSVYGKRILNAYTGSDSWNLVNGKYINT